MFSEPYLVKFKFDVENLQQNQNYLWLHINGTAQKFTPNISLLAENHYIKFDIQHINPSLYFTEQTYIHDFVNIKSITVDDFWIFKPPFLFNKVTYDNKYAEHVSLHGGSWETELTENCQSFHFNGRLHFNFKFPIIRNFK